MAKNEHTKKWNATKDGQVPKRGLSKGLKGEYNGICNRTACQQPGATFFNHSTLKFYCPSCAHTINEYNRAEAMTYFGHDLCTEGDDDE